MELRFQKCIKNQLNQLVEISRTTFVAAFLEENNSIDFNTYINKAFSIATISKEINNADSYFFFVYLEKELVGYFKLNEFMAQTDFKDVSGIELQRIYIKKEFQGKNIGSHILLRAIEIAAQKRKSYIWLGVWEYNLDAIRFYRRHGFTKFGTHPYYIGNDKQTDWVMKKEL